MKKNFVKREEDFKCLNCGEEVKGGGYTNHCPNCLFSLHVDELVPGDRESSCKGLMEPVKTEIKGDEYLIFHRCQKCGKEMKNKSSDNDNFEEILRLST